MVGDYMGKELGIRLHQEAKKGWGHLFVWKMGYLNVYIYLCILKMQRIS